MNKISRLFAICVVSIGLAGCAQTVGNKEFGGTLLGAGLGGLLGSQIGGGKGKMIAIGVGVLLGGLLGSEIGRSLDRADKLYMIQATQNSLENSPTGSLTGWRNPDSGNQGTITPLATYRKPSGQYCREYQSDITVGGKTEQAYGTACRMPDGSWEVQ